MPLPPMARRSPRRSEGDLPVYSLYGETQRPTAEMLENIDVIVCDIQDIGVRYYTFIWTISHILEAAGEHGIEVLILDRPNPLGGVDASKDRRSIRRWRRWSGAARSRSGTA